MNREREDTTSMRLGKGMIIAAWGILLLLLTLFFHHYLTQEHNPNSQPSTDIGAGGAQEVRLKRNRAGHYIATGEINGAPVIFLVDTGATDVAIPIELAERIGLKGRAQVYSQTAAGTTVGRQTILRSVRLGLIEQHNVRAIILPSMKGDEALLGMSFLKHLELAQQGNYLILRQYPVRP